MMEVSFGDITGFLAVIEDTPSVTFMNIYYICMCACMYVCIHTHTHIYIYIYIYREREREREREKEKERIILLQHVSVGIVHLQIIQHTRIP